MRYLDPADTPARRREFRDRECEAMWERGGMTDAERDAAIERLARVMDEAEPLDLGALHS